MLAALLLLLPSLTLAASRPDPPTEIVCLNVEMDGEQGISRSLDRPIPVTASGEIRSAFVRIGQEMVLLGGDAEKVRGSRIVQVALESDYIEVFYNQKRRHSTIGQISPAEYERRTQAA